MLLLVYGILLNLPFTNNAKGREKQTIQVEVEINQERMCKIPELMYEGHNDTEREKACKIKENWGFLKENRWYLSETIKNDLIKISCHYEEIQRKNDFLLVNGPRIELEEGDLIKIEVFEVFCSGFTKNSRSSKKFDMLFAQVIDKLPDKKTDPNLHKPDKNGCTPMNVMLLSYDSVSRVSWKIRQKKSLKYMFDEMNFEILNGYNIFGDGTPAG
jgi:hypothetical protein